MAAIRANAVGSFLIFIEYRGANRFLEHCLKHGTRVIADRAFESEASHSRRLKLKDHAAEACAMVPPHTLVA